MRLNHLLCIVSLLIALICAQTAFAEQLMVGLGDFADSLIAPVGMLAKLIDSAAMIIGIACLFGAAMRYSQFRINPVAAPLSSIVVLLILGIALLSLPLLNVFFTDSVAFLQN